MLDGVVDGKRVATYVQTTFFQVDAIERRFVAVETNSGVAACLVSDDFLQYGYLQSPTPVKGSLQPHAGEGLVYRAHHRWHDARANDEEAYWLVFCALHQDELGCLSLTTRWVTQVLDTKSSASGQSVPKTETAVIEWNGDTVEWASGSQRVRATLQPKISQVLDRGTLWPLPARTP